MGTRASRYTPSGVGRGLSGAGKAGAGLEAGAVVVRSFGDTGVSVGVRVGDAVGAGVGVNADRDAAEGQANDGGGGTLSKYLDDAPRSVGPRLPFKVDRAAVGTPRSGVLPGAHRACRALMKSKMRRAISLLGDVAFDKLLLLILLGILQVGESVKSSLNLTSTNSQPILNPQKSFFVVLYNCSFSI